MCGGSSPKPPPPPAPPPPPPPPPKPLEIAPSAQAADVLRTKGRAALRIDRTINSDGTVGSGLNIPS